MLVLPVGKTLGPGDLTLMVRDERNQPATPVSINYSLFKVERDGAQVLVAEPMQAPAQQELGLYYVAMTVPSSWAEGVYRIVWAMQQTAAAPEVTVVEDFSVMMLRPETSSIEAPSVLIARRLNVTEKVAEIIMQVRKLLRDDNPDRNYNFRPPTSGRVVAGYTTRVGFIWEDETILRMLKLVVAQINTSNPRAVYDYNLEGLDENWAQCAALGAAAKCLTAEAARWIADEFGYSLNGVSLDLEKSTKYQGLGQQYAEEFKEWMVPLTANKPTSRGLRQMKWLR